MPGARTSSSRGFAWIASTRRSEQPGTNFRHYYGPFIRQFRFALTRDAIALGALLVSIGACEDTSPAYRMVKSPDGNHWWYDITCEGSMADCLDSARRACHGRPYDVMDSANAGTAISGRGARIGNAVFTQGQATNDMEILVQCAAKRAPSPGAPVRDDGF
jgi:hypothetical protein